MNSERFNSCVVLGNGPSLKGFDFKRLNGCNTVGMNAAYRFWDTIDWYPTFYTCLDDQLIKTHHQRIYDMWKEGRVKHFYLEGGFFDFHPDCIGAKGMTSLDQTVKVLFDRRGKSQGWEFIDHPAFRTHDHNKITTGAYAVRFASWLGHERVAIAGVDLKYVEILPEAKSTGGYALEMKETPKENPNYFFDGYQKAGDKYNIPNPDVHNKRLHIDSFHVMAKDFLDNGVKTALFNLNPNSLLQEERVIPLTSVDGFLDSDGISAVVVPTNIYEKSYILNNFKIWNDPDYAPRAYPDAHSKPKLCFYFNNDTGREIEPEIRSAYTENDMDRYFDGISFEYLGLTGDRDLYERDYTKKVGRYGFKSGPNHQFFETMKRAAKLGQYIFQMETDCVPLGPDWLTTIDEDVREEGPFWVLGTLYHGVHPLEPAYRYHLNGNATYAVGDAGFQEFLVDFWEHWTWKLVAESDPRLAYDCIVEKVFNDLGDEEGVEATRIRSHRMLRDTTALLNISGSRDLGDGLHADYVNILAKRFPKAKLLHNRTAHQRVMEKLENNQHPRMLIIDMTPMGNGTATGEIKSNLTKAWPENRLLQLARHGKDGLSLVRPKTDAGYEETPVSEADAFEQISAFRPDTILYRPVPNVPWLHKAAMSLIKALNKPVMTWIMDDWPAELEAKDPEQWASLKPDLEHLIETSKLRLSICDAMSRCMEERYGVPFVALANGVDPKDWPSVSEHKKKRLRVKYAGGLAKNMTKDSVLRIARAIERLGEAGHHVKFEINTQPWWYKEAAAEFSHFKFTKIASEDRSAAAYRSWLQHSNVVIIAYNFDQETLRYVQHSMANKMPECLASGAVLFAHGPTKAATIAYLESKNIASVVTEQDDAAVEAELLRMLSHPNERQSMVDRAREFVFENHNINTLGDQLRSLTLQMVTGDAGRAGATTVDGRPGTATASKAPVTPVSMPDPAQNNGQAAPSIPATAAFNTVSLQPEEPTAKADVLALASRRAADQFVRAVIVEATLRPAATRNRLRADSSLSAALNVAIEQSNLDASLRAKCAETLE